MGVFLTELKKILFFFFFSRILCVFRFFVFSSVCNWRRLRHGQKEYYFDRDLHFYVLNIPKESFRWMKQQNIIQEMGTDNDKGGKQWVHLYKTNVKCRATIENIVLWEADLLTKEEMELLALEADPNFKPKTSKDVSASAAGVWRAA